LGWFAAAIVFGNGQGRAKVDPKRSFWFQKAFPTRGSAGAPAHRRVTGKKAVIRRFSQESEQKWG